MWRSTLIGLCLGLAWCSSTVHAIELMWSNGQKDIRVATTRVCTLLVVQDPGVTPLPNEWYFTWSGDSPLPLSFVDEAPNSSQAATCEIRGGPTIDLASMDTLLFCKNPSLPRSLAARCIVSVAGGMTVNIAMIIPQERLRSAHMTQVTVNGGSTSLYPPTLASVQIFPAGQSAFVAAAGLFQDMMASAALVAANGRSAALKLVAQTSTSATFRGDVPEGFQPDYLVVRDALGRSGAYRMGDSSSEAITGPCFTTNSKLAPGDEPRVTFGDLDSNGRLDFAAVGGTAGKIYLNPVGPPPFIDAGIVLPRAQAGSVECADYDRDGDLDLLIAGYDPSVGEPLTRILRQDATSFTFTEVTTSLPGIWRGNATWGDFNNDGRPDILICGWTTSGTSIASVYQNSGGNFFPSAWLDGVFWADGRWGDYDNDGDLDILLTGNNGTLLSPIPISKVYRNDYGVFTAIASGLTGMWKSAASWVDYDNDGDLDIAIAGATAAHQEPELADPAALVYRNDGNGVFVDIAAALMPVFAGGMAWGDYDGYGRPDVLLTGLSGSLEGTCHLYQNEESGFFDLGPVPPFFSLPDAEAGLYLGNAEWGAWSSINGFTPSNPLMCGFDTSPPQAWRVWYDNACQQNLNPVPPAPTGLVGLVDGSGNMSLNWDAATGDNTPSAGLSYNVRVGTTPGGNEIVAAMAGSNGFRRVARLGNAQKRHSYTVKGATGGPPYYWSVQAVDAVYAGGPFASSTIASSTVGVEDAAGAPGIALELVGGNPVVGEAVLRLRLDRPTACRVRVFDAMGRVVGALVDKTVPAGEHRLKWTAKGKLPGLYFAIVQIGRRSLVQRLVVLR